MDRSNMMMNAAGVNARQAPRRVSRAALASGAGGSQLGHRVTAELVQAKLTVSSSEEPLEQQAERVANAVVDANAMGETAEQVQLPRAAASNPPLATVEVESAIDALPGRGSPLPESVRAFMEPRFKADFSSVRVHNDAASHRLARAVQAQAFTVGRDVVFGAGYYAPEHDRGKHLLAHELTHVLQQSGGRSWDLLARQPAAPAASPAAAAPPAAAAAPDAGTPATAAPAPTLAITRQGGTGSTFLSSDTITFAAQVSGVPNASALVDQVSWTVRSVSANSGTGNPHTLANKAQFSFQPTPTNRPTTGSRSPNAPISIAVDAQVSGVTASATLEQDEADILRQEYVDFGAAAPDRGSVVTPASAGFNTGNYSLIVDNGLGGALSGTQSEFQRLTLAAAAPPAAPAAAPAAAAPAAAAPAAPAAAAAPAPPAAAPVAVPAIAVESGYRNPRRNVAAGSNFPVTSRHVWGSALDLSVAGPTAALWQRLRDAGAAAGYTSICEDGPTQKPCNDPTIDHVHLQW